VFVSHSMEAVLDLCDRAVLLHRGQRLYTGKSKATVARYQKLSAATETQAEQIIAEIVKDDAHQGAETVVYRSEPQDQHGAIRAADGSSGAAGNAIRQEPEPEASFDPHLVSKSVVTYPENGAAIRNPRIVAKNGQVVNCLIPGHRYQLCYEVLFKEDNPGVFFRTMIKTVTGVQLGGGQYPSTRSDGFHARSHELVRVAFEFSCTLRRGTYFVNCGVGTKGGESLNRIIDALVFRIDEVRDAFFTGVVDFGVKAEVSRESIPSRASLFVTQDAWTE
jgi:lipopolysaccharide transport system ATP-binding protein